MIQGEFYFKRERSSKIISTRKNIRPKEEYEWRAGSGGEGRLCSALVILDEFLFMFWSKKLIDMWKVAFLFNFYIYQCKEV
jgi:hypothetical protein